jgi:hypothetical protein
MKLVCQGANICKPAMKSRILKHRAACDSLIELLGIIPGILTGDFSFMALAVESA